MKTSISAIIEETKAEGFTTIAKGLIVMAAKKLSKREGISIKDASIQIKDWLRS